MLTWLASLATLALVISATPGPNNVLFAASGGRVGLTGTLPGILGMLVGSAVINATCALGAGQLVSESPRAELAMTALASAYMMWLSFSLYFSDANKGGSETGATALLTWWHMAVLQLVNPKTWLAAIALAAGYLGSNSPGGPLVDVLAIAVFLTVVGISASAWTLFGAVLNARLAASRWRTFNRILGGLTVASVITLWL